MPKKTKAVTKTKKGQVVLATNFEQDAKRGFETADKDAYAIPFLTILQDLSPQVKKRNAEYVEGAEPGMIFNTVTEKVYSGEKGILIIPVSYHRNWIEWTPRSQGGGFVNASNIEPPGAEWTEENNYCLPNGNELIDTRNHYVIIVDELEPALICMVRTQLKKSRKFMSQMQALKFEGAGGKLFTPPMFASVFKITSTVEQKDQFQWYGWKIERVRNVNSKEYEVAKGFLDAIKEERTVTDYSNLTEQKVDSPGSDKKTKKNDKDIPF